MHYIKFHWVSRTTQAISHQLSASGEQVPFQAPHLMLQGHTNVVSAEEGTQLHPGNSSVCYFYSSALLIAAFACLNSPHCKTTMLPVLLLQSFTSNQLISKAAVTVAPTQSNCKKPKIINSPRYWAVCYIYATCY